MLTVARSGRYGRRHRRFLTCCVRVSPEKNPMLFADVVYHLRTYLTQHNVIPLLCAPKPNGTAVPTEDYRACVVQRFMSANVPGARLIEEFLNVEQLAEIFDETLLNVHPPVYDAYGMSVVEAAALGAPTILHHNDTSIASIGAAELLDPKQGASFAADMSSTDGMQAAQSVQAVLEQLLDPAILARASERGRALALSWDAASNTKTLWRIVQQNVLHPRT
eukprot:m.430313 g.430313  ORF g.430313 m.430313 type:complete len:221 (-) comp21394_c0_seq1:68-730(-)